MFTQRRKSFKNVSLSFCIVEPPGRQGTKKHKEKTLHFPFKNLKGK